MSNLKPIIKAYEIIFFVRIDDSDASIVTVLWLLLLSAYQSFVQVKDDGLLVYRRDDLGNVTYEGSFS